MFRNDLVKLSVTWVFVVATAFVSVASVAAAGSDTIRLAKPASVLPAISGTADDWFQRHPDAGIPADTTTDTSIPSSLDNPNGRWMGPETVSAALSMIDNSNGRWIGPGTVSAALSLLDDSNGRWIGPETVSAALRQLQP